MKSPQVNEVSQSEKAPESTSTATIGPETQDVTAASDSQQARDKIELQPIQ